MSLLCISSNFDGIEIIDSFYAHGQIWFNEEIKEKILPMSTILDQAKIGTWVVIKSFNPQNGLTIKGIGYIYDNQNWSTYYIGMENTIQPIARNVKWLWKGKKNIGKIDDKMDHMRTGIMYFELNQNVVEQIFSLLDPIVEKIEL